MSEILYNESLLINRIQTITGYTTSYAESVSLDNLDLAVPRVYVGHLGIKMRYPEDFWADSYREQDNPLAVLTSIQFIASSSEISTVFNNIYTSLEGFSPIQDINYSTVSFVEANTVQTLNDRTWMQLIVAVITPRIS